MQYLGKGRPAVVYLGFWKEGQSLSSSIAARRGGCGRESTTPAGGEVWGLPRKISLFLRMKMVSLMHSGTLF